jgi:hypothetical protein
MALLHAFGSTKVDAIERSGRVRVGSCRLVVCKYVLANVIFAMAFVIDVLLMENHPWAVVLGDAILVGEIVQFLGRLHHQILDESSRQIIVR